MKPILLKPETGYILFGHGSSVESANDAVRTVAANFAQQGGHRAVETAFLEGGKPDLAGAVAALAARGIDDIIVIPYFLTLGTHLQRDLPKLVDQARAGHSGVKIEVTPPLDDDIRRCSKHWRTGPSENKTMSLDVYQATDSRMERNRTGSPPLAFSKSKGWENFDFIPGQFVSLTDGVNGKPIKRAYLHSLRAASATNRFELCLNLVHEGAFTPHFFSLNVGVT